MQLRMVRCGDGMGCGSAIRRMKSMRIEYEERVPEMQAKKKEKKVIAFFIINTAIR
jgi:hypothetical protein